MTIESTERSLKRQRKFWREKVPKGGHVKVREKVMSASERERISDDAEIEARVMGHLNRICRQRFGSKF